MDARIKLTPEEYKTCFVSILGSEEHVADSQ